MQFFKNLSCLIFVIIFSVIIISTEVSASTVILPKTGQTNCWNASGISIACIGTGQDGEYQKGLPLSGERFVDNGNGTIYDRVTNLTWQKCSRGQDVLKCSGVLTTSNWSGALSYCNTLNLAGSKWRLPNRNELASIIDLSGVEPTLNNKMFPNTPEVYYWTSTTFQQVYTSAWVVNFGNGVVNFNVKTLPNYVRCVK